ncbi:hypothetical protein [Paucisalibacillus globulus]|uniref:hypothetical protein n=1 Tax=Paucisalibacillus globulus TaxID=351095 RepID=UPI0004241830|nr:hypothetical protein [Paucisalibacillus globulus]
MYVNPFILKRENILEKSAIKHEFDTEIFLEIDHLEGLLNDSRDEIIDNLNELLMKSNNSLLLNAIRYLRKNKFLRFVNSSNEIKELVPENLKEEIEKFNSLYNQFVFLSESAESMYSNSLKEVRQRFIDILKENSSIANGLHMVNPQIYSKLTSYLHTPLEEHKSKHRKVEGTLYNFISRSALKTSPFSDITNVGRVQLLDQNIVAENYHKSVSLNYTFVYKMTFYYLYKSNLFIENINYTIPPFSISTENGQHYIEFLSKKDNTERAKVYLSEERLGKLKIPKSLVDLFNEKDMDNYLTFDELHSILGKEIAKEKIHFVIRNYLKIGLLIPVIGFNEKNYQALVADVKNKLVHLLEEKSYIELITYLDEIYDTTKQISSAKEIHEKHSCFNKLNSILKEIKERTGINFSSNQVFYEDGYYSDVEYMESKVLDQFISPLLQIQKFTLIFDTSIRLRYEFAARLKDLGTQDYLEMDSDFFSILFDLSKDMMSYWENPAYIASEQFHSKDLRELDKLKFDFMEDINTLCKHDASSTIDIKDLIDTYIQKIPEKILMEKGISTGVFAQINQDNLIINSLYEGQERYSARFMNYFKDYLNEDADYRNYIKDFYDDNNYYELTDTYGFNGNVKEQRLSRECYTLGVGTRRFTMENNDSLHMVEDFKVDIRDGLFRFIDVNGEEAKICFRGSLSPTYMPGYIAILLQMFTSGAMYYKLGEMVKKEHIPRITYGNIILTRKRVCLTFIQDELIRKEIEGDYEYYKRLNLVFSKFELDKEFFIVIDRSTQLNDEELLKFKPLYINIENPLSVKVFEKEIVDKFDKSVLKLLFMEEYLSNSGPYAKELNYEIYQKGGEEDGRVFSTESAKFNDLL